MSFRSGSDSILISGSGSDSSLIFVGLLDQVTSDSSLMFMWYLDQIVTLV